MINIYNEEMKKKLLQDIRKPKGKKIEKRRKEAKKE